MIPSTWHSAQCMAGPQKTGKEKVFSQAGTGRLNVWLFIPAAAFVTQPPSQSQNIYTTTKTVSSLGLGEFYLKLLFFPGLLSNFLLSKGNLSPPISNIFSASCKKRRHYFILDQMKPKVYTSPFFNHHNFYLIFSPFIISKYNYVLS